MCSARAKTFFGSTAAKDTNMLGTTPFSGDPIPTAPILMPFWWSSVSEEDESLFRPGSPFSKRFDKISIHYCDGKAYSGKHGKAIVDAAIESALEKLAILSPKPGSRKDYYKTVLFVGVSAGGQGVILNADRIREKYFRQQGTSTNINFLAVPIAGFFPMEARSIRRGPRPQDAEKPLVQDQYEEVPYFESLMSRVFVGEDPLHSECVVATQHQHPWECFLGENALRYTKTRTLVLQTSNDAWQMCSTVFPDYCFPMTGKFFPEKQINSTLYGPTVQIENRVLAFQERTRKALSHIAESNENVSYYLSRCLNHQEEWAKVLESDVPGAKKLVLEWMFGTSSKKIKLIDEGQPKQCACFGPGTEGSQCLFY